MLKTIDTLLFGSGCMRIALILRWAKFNTNKGNLRISKLLLLWIERHYGVYIGINTQIGERVKIPHPVGIVIGDGVKIGDDCTIFQNVTLGGARIGDSRSGHYPVVGNNTVLFAGSKILGAVVIGSNCIIGANAVVTNSVPDGHVAVGIPAYSYPNTKEMYHE